MDTTRRGAIYLFVSGSAVLTGCLDEFAQSSDESSPQSTVEEFYATLGGGDLNTANSIVHNQSPMGTLSYGDLPDKMVSVEPLETELLEQGNRLAVVWVDKRFEIESEDGPRFETEGGRVSLRRDSNSEWRVWDAEGKVGGTGLRRYRGEESQENVEWSGEFETSFDDPQNRVRAVSFSHDGRWIAMSDGNSWELPGVYVYSVEDDWEHVTTLTELPSNNVIDSLEFSSDDERLAYTGAYDDSTVYVHDTDDWSLERTISGAHSLYSVEFTPDGGIAYGGSDETLRIEGSGGEKEAFGVDGRAKSIDANEDGYIAVATKPGRGVTGPGNTAHVFRMDGTNGWTRETEFKTSEDAWYVSLSPDGRWLAYGDREGNELIVRSVGDGWEEELELTTGDLRGHDFSPNSQWLAYGDAESNSIEILTAGGSWETDSVIDAEGGPNQVEFSKDGNWIAYSAGTDVYVHRAIE